MMFFFLFCNFVSVLYFIIYKPKLKLNNNRLVVIFFYLLFVVYASNLNIVKAIPVIIFFCCSEETIEDIFTSITRWFSWILIPSLLLFVLLLFQDITPPLGYISYDAILDGKEIETAYSEYANYLLLIKGVFYDIRFNSIFLEPGHLGMISSFMLFANGYNFKKKECWVILFAIILSLSLAGYVLTIM